jgi:hypothetical protein
LASLHQGNTHSNIDEIWLNKCEKAFEILATPPETVLNRINNVLFGYELLKSGQILISKDHTLKDSSNRIEQTILQYVSTLDTQPVFPKVSVKTILLMILQLQGKVNADIPFYLLTSEQESDSSITIYDNFYGNFCVTCNQEFETIEQLTDHCWINHAEDIFRIVDSRATAVAIRSFISEFCCQFLYLKDEEDQCCFCKVKFSNDQLLLTHFVKFHSKCVLVHSEEHWLWPLKAHAFCLELNNPHHLINDESKKYLFQTGIITKSRTCSDCFVKPMHIPPLSRHIFEFHTILVPK